MNPVWLHEVEREQNTIFKLCPSVPSKLEYWVEGEPQAKEMLKL